MKIFDSVAQMKLATIKAGQYVETFGYYTKGDAGAARYLVVASQAADGYGDHVLANGTVAVLQSSGTVNVKQVGAVGDDVADDSDAIIKAIELSYATVRKLFIPAGTYKVTKTISANISNLEITGAGTDVTIIKATGVFKTCLEVNNGSWDDSTDTYSLSGSSIGSVTMSGFTLDGTASTGCTGLVLARATLGCVANRVKIIDFSAGMRNYGSWYSKYNQVILENNDINQHIGYESNDMTFSGCDWISDPANQSSMHIDTAITGTCRNVNFLGCGFDGVPTIAGMRMRGIHNLNFRDCYLEVYNSEVTKTANFIELGLETIGVVIDGCNLITGTGYSGTWVKCGIANGDAGKNITFGTNFQLNGGTNTCTVIDTEFSLAVSLGNSRTERPISITNPAEIIPSAMISTFIPATTGLDEITVPISTVRKKYTIPVTRIKVVFLESGTTLTTQKLRVINDANSVLVNWELPNIITAGDTHYITDDSFSLYETVTGEPAINSVMESGDSLRAYTYKVGTGWPFPAMSIYVEMT